MYALKSLNVAIRFLLELCVLLAVGYWGFTSGWGWFLKIVLGICIPLLIAVTWGKFGAPKSSTKLYGIWLFGLEIIVFGSGIVALYATQHYSLASGFAVIIIINKILMLVWRQ